MKRDTYYYGAGMKWGIYNTVSKEFQFGICEDSPMLAEARLFYKIGDDARKYRFEARVLPSKKKDGGRVSADNEAGITISEKKKRVIQGLKVCSPDNCGREKCPYYEGPESEYWSNPAGYGCEFYLRQDAISLLEEVEQ